MSDLTSVVNPATESVIAEVPRQGVEEVDAAVARSLEAASAWRSLAPTDRARLLRRLADQGRRARRGAGTAGDPQRGQADRRES